MTPEQEQLLQNISERLDKLEKSDRYVFEKDLELANGRKILVPTSGLYLGNAVTDKVGFFGTTPIVKQAAPSTASGCAGDADTKLNSLIADLQNYGLLI